MKVASYALSSSAIIFFLIVVADLKGLFTNKCMMYTNAALVWSDLGWEKKMLFLQGVNQFPDSKAIFLNVFNFIVKLHLYMTLLKMLQADQAPICDHRHVTCTLVLDAVVAVNLT